MASQRAPVVEALEGLSPSMVEPADMPSTLDPMLATLAHEPTAGDAWVYERKLDGVRALAFCDGDEVRLLSRKRQRLEGTYPEVVEALETRAAGRIVLDGEIVAFAGERTSFERLQGRMQITDPARALRTGIEVHYYVFDLLHLEGYRITRLPLVARKEILARAVRFSDPLRYTEHVGGDGAMLLDKACRDGWEGLIAKRVDAPYRHRRSRDWLKLKCSRRQEFVVGGWSEPEGSRTGFGALLIGYHDQGELSYAGKVGTGFSEEALRSTMARLRELEADRPPFTKGAPPRKRVHWVRPDLVCEVDFTEWTRDGRLRHPRFVGFRFDKDPHTVVREEA